MLFVNILCQDVSCMSPMSLCCRSKFFFLDSYTHFTTRSLCTPTDWINYSGIYETRVKKHIRLLHLKRQKKRDLLMIIVAFHQTER